jgi:hypothetical protein
MVIIVQVPPDKLLILFRGAVDNVSENRIELSTNLFFECGDKIPIQFKEIELSRIWQDASACLKNARRPPGISARLEDTGNLLRVKGFQKIAVGWLTPDLPVVDTVGSHFERKG